ncbi:MAG: hypothetical protein GXP56_03750 [Deltaproteobacteria bacterium]|nr:hypothetical protein [Deltaproteobacteria bacterium]
MGKNYVIELDGSTYCLSGRTLEIHNDFESVTGCKFLVTDFDKSVTRVMHVDADVKYAEAMVTRRLQEEGEFDEPVSIITHWKKRKGKKNARIFFTALPSRIYFKYLEKINEHNDLLLLIPVFSVLANFINQVAQKEPIAVIFRHGRFIDLVVAKKNQFYFATRCVAFDTGKEQIASLWQTLSREISSVVLEKSIRVERLICLNWIDSEKDIPVLDSRDIEIFMFNEEQITHARTIYSISFTKALKMFPPMEGLAPGNGKLFYFSDKLSPFMLAFFTILVFIFLWGTFFFQSKTNDLVESISSIETRLDSLNKIDLPDPGKVKYLDTLKFIDSIFYNKHLPSYKDIINDISMGIFPSAIIDKLQVDYLDRKVVIKLSGVVSTDFEKAYKGYQALLSNLQKDGYAVENKSFNTRIDSSRFELALSRSIK